jgi:hypothetical protein
LAADDPRGIKDSPDAERRYGVKTLLNGSGPPVFTQERAPLHQQAFPATRELKLRSLSHLVRYAIRHQIISA